MKDNHMIPYRVILKPAGANTTIEFDCAAEFDLEAVSKAETAYPGCTVLTYQAYAHLLYSDVA